MKLFGRNKNKALDPRKIPMHIAIVMDGNGRWAAKRGLPRVAGHRAGLDSARAIMEESVRLGVKYLTLYTFSTENWKRPQEEVDFIMSLPEEFWTRDRSSIDEMDIRLNILGDLDGLSESTRRVSLEAMGATHKRKGLTVNLALNYGGRAEIIRAANAFAKAYPTGEGSEQDFAKFLYTSDMPDPDLLIRPGAEKRISNFLLWQLAYTEMVFTDCLWPDFNVKQFQDAILEYQTRDRRRGGLKV
ncbi:MAG: undecaprenyl diphosphate synthase [Bacillota bacterium]|nr:MAG: undecaprenyl diphosphate synthase [Bacillota bacterium]